MEFGLRTLGARSIIADPRSESKQKNLNLKAIHSSPFISEVGSKHLRNYYNFMLYFKIHKPRYSVIA